jgi:hypothetical protein
VLPADEDVGDGSAVAIGAGGAQHDTSLEHQPRQDLPSAIAEGLATFRHFERRRARFEALAVALLLYPPDPPNHLDHPAAVQFDEPDELRLVQPGGWAAGSLECTADLGVGHCLAHCVAQTRDQRGWQAGRHEQPCPDVEFDVL